MAKQATDTFVAVLSDGTERRVVKGEVYADGHDVVRHAPGLFSDFGADEKPAKPTRRTP